MRTIQKLLVIVGVAGSQLFFTAALRAENWAEKLGFPRGSRVVIFDAREMGLTWEMNDAGKELLEAGHVQSAGFVATGAWIEDFAQWSRKHRKVDVGLSLALTNPYKNPRWQFVTRREKIPSLVDADGLPWKTLTQFGSNAKTEEVEIELEAQIRRARDLGIQISHLNGYHGTIFARSDLVAVLLNAARRHWIPAPVIELTPEHIERFRSEGFPLEDDLVDMFRAYPLPKLDDLQFLPAAETYEQKLDQLCAMLSSMQPGLTQIILHPASHSPGIERVSEGWRQRVWDAKVVKDKKVQAIVKAEGILFTNWKEIMHRFEGKQPLADDEL